MRCNEEPCSAGTGAGSRHQQQHALRRLAGSHFSSCIFGPSHLQSSMMPCVVPCSTQLAVPQVMHIKQAQLAVCRQRGCACCVL